MNKLIIIGIILMGAGWLLKGIFQNSVHTEGRDDIISVEELREKISTNNPVMIDVRTVPEFDGPLGHVDGSILIPLHELESRMTEIDPYKNEEIIMICRSGNRSGKATTILRSKGFNALNMVGGMKRWNAVK